MLDFRVVRVNFPQIAGAAQTAGGIAAFGSAVRTAQMAVNGFDISFGNTDHHLGQFQIHVIGPLSNTGSRVFFDVTVLLRDFSGNIDDPFGGWVDVLVIADLV